MTAMINCTKKIQIYRPRRPEKTVLFQVIKKHYKTWNKNAKDPIPSYIDKEFKKYLGCGILAKGFACAHCEGCNKDFLIAFSCKGRGICPSCNTRTMVETATNLVENLIPSVPNRQWVISFPLRIRHYLQTQTILQEVLRIVIDEIKKKLIICSPDASNPQIGAVSFIQNFGNSLNVHPHFHIVAADGIFSVDGADLKFYDTCLTPDDIADTQDAIKKRVLKFFHRRGWFDKETMEKMLTYENSGFSLNAKVLVPSWDREGLERLMRYCARPPFASENLRMHGSLLVYRFPKMAHTGQTCIQLTPLDFIEKIVALIPPPHRHRRHYHGVFAPSSPLRQKVAANAKKRPEAFAPGVTEAADKVKKVSINWAMLIARIYETEPLTCASCGKKITILSFVTQAEEIRRILKGTVWPADPPEFDPPYELDHWDICQLLPGTQDGFPEDEWQVDAGPDPPWEEVGTPMHWEDHIYIDPPHYEE
jgi:Putative transposase/Transposase zinc-binding domain